MRIRAFTLAIGFSQAFFPTVALAHGEGIPGYLFPDGRFWLFTAFFALALAEMVCIILFLLSRRWRPETAAGAMLPKSAYLVLCFALLYQGFHMMEHVAQGYQFWVLDLPAKESRGILWFFDIEWNHFIFNLGYILALAYGGLWILRICNRANSVLCTPTLLLIVGGLLVEGVHLLEHTVRLVEHLTIGCEPCPGILDRLLGVTLISLHFAYNMVVLLIPLTAFFWFGLHRRLQGN